ncbi:MAG: aldo/keto reductase [Bryobacterales bacterium]|nr:aldo/keto reductase [Bryobacteraceae bacterium]MDW8129750.1 aldo/keto reductase [Bryobacterales bacterium]
MQRRAFLQLGLNAAGAALLKAAPEVKQASDRILLGPMKVPVTRLAMGTGTHGVGGSSNQTRKLGLGGLADLLEAACDRGVRFWDSADQYGTHPHLRHALRRVPREKVAILTKTRASTAAEMRADLDRFRRELGTDYIDILLLHCMIAADWPERMKPVMEVIAEARERGIVRTHGVSCHSLEALSAAAADPWTQVILARINPAGVVMDGPPEKIVPVLRTAKAAGKGIIGMKIFGVGRLRSRADECLRYALTLDCVDCFTIGVESRQELEDLVARIGRAGAAG